MSWSHAIVLFALGLSANVSCSSSSTCATMATTVEWCPAEWSRVEGMMYDLCFRFEPQVSAFRSTAPCRGRLHYSRHFFDAGPRTCLYDPVTLKLVGYGAFDPKAMVDERTCTIAREDFDDRDCPGVTCQALGDGGAGD